MSECVCVCVGRVTRVWTVSLNVLWNTCFCCKVKRYICMWANIWPPIHHQSQTSKKILFTIAMNVFSKYIYKMKGCFIVYVLRNFIGRTKADPLLGSCLYFLLKVAMNNLRLAAASSVWQIVSHRSCQPRGVGWQYSGIKYPGRFKFCCKNV